MSRGNRDKTVPLGRPLRVLVADDDRDTVMNLGILLRSEGIEVQLARGGLKVPEAVAQFHPDAVLLDLAVSRHNGLDVAQELTKRYGERCPVLIPLTKPYDPDALLKLVFSITRK